METHVFVNDDEVTLGKPFKYSISNTAKEAHTISISILVHFDVDFARRNSEVEYADLLRESGVIVSDVCMENGVVEELPHLTFGSYVNEAGIS